MKIYLDDERNLPLGYENLRWAISIHHSRHGRENCDCADAIRQRIALDRAREELDNAIRSRRLDGRETGATLGADATGE